MSPRISRFLGTGVYLGLVLKLHVLCMCCTICSSIYAISTAEGGFVQYTYIYLRVSIDIYPTLCLSSIYSIRPAAPNKPKSSLIVCGASWGIHTISPNSFFDN